MVNNYTPQSGDIVWVHLKDSVGHEQKGRRPALVVSDSSYNKISDLCLVCFITSKQKDYPFEVPFIAKTISGCVLSDQIHTLDYAARRLNKVDEVDKEIISKVKKK